ncbi:MAG TPA: xanthine dehydrogenase family protein molybdopterin-binding subunit, partial [Variovorax sp.]
MDHDTTSPDPLRFGSGQAVRRLEDQALLSGAGRYTDDVQPAGLTHLIFVRSPYPHARIVSVDLSAAREMPGVVGILSGADLAAAGVQPMPGTAGFKRPDGGPGVS